MKMPRHLLLWILVINGAVVALGLVLGLLAGDIDHHFDEGHLVTWASVVQLLVIAGLSFRMLAIRRRTFVGRLWTSRRFFWALVAVGFLLLAVDDASQIHETADRQIHSALAMEESGLSDRLDDVIVGIYALVGLAVLFHYRAEWRPYSDALPFLRAGILLVFVMIGLDLLTNRTDIVFGVVADGDVAGRIYASLAVAEDALKLFAEGLFVFGCVRAISSAGAGEDRHGSPVLGRQRGGSGG